MAAVLDQVQAQMDALQSLYTQSDITRVMVEDKMDDLARAILAKAALYTAIIARVTGLRRQTAAAEAGPAVVPVAPARKPSWLKVKAPGGPTYLQIKSMMRDLGLAELDPQHDRAMICGSPGMLADFRSLLDRRGFEVSPRIGTPGQYVFERAFVEK